MAWLWSFWLVLEIFFVTPLEAVTFERRRMTLGSAELTVEIAETPAQQERGLMFRKELKEGTGMLFIFSGESPRSFWMKNTFVALDIGFFDQKRTLVDIQQMEPVGSVMEIPKSYVSRRPAKYALEVPQGWFKKFQIKEGAVFRLDGSQ